MINAKITTTLTSYLALYYKTEVAIEGTAVFASARSLLSLVRPVNRSRNSFLRLSTLCYTWHARGP